MGLVEMGSRAITIDYTVRNASRMYMWRMIMKTIQPFVLCK